uniref:Leucine-rich repeat-containing N-terminal plant-type domain-containing protein n=1 Tax=Setaria digitata TaxID=48799 RepID=A0A915PXN0_9BILA
MSPYSTAQFIGYPYPVTYQQLTESNSVPESSRNKLTACHRCRERVEAMMLGVSANSTPHTDHDEESGTSDRHKDKSVYRFAAIGGYYNCEVNKMHNMGEKDRNDKHCSNPASDHKSKDSTQERYKVRIYDNERRQQRKLVTHEEKRSEKSDTINRFIGSFILFISTIPLSLGCPESITSFCRCDDSQNGITLKCSHTDGLQVVHTLKANQINLGLIQQLEMQDSGLKHLPAAFFSGLFIKKLDLSHNSITDIDENSFMGMNSVLQVLILRHNNLTQLPSKALKPLSALQRLDLSNNSIGDIQVGHVLPPLSKLYDISLANNRICQIHKNAFDNVKYIQTINLGRNCLKEVPASEALSFVNLPLINLLNLASNQISTVDKQAFLNVPNLRHLYLTRNRINDILPHQFSSFEQLEMLDLTGNYLTELRENSFSNMQNLRRLYLGENRIKSIKPGSFTNSSVVILILNSNCLEEIQEGMFDGLVKLQQLALKDNQIKSIDQNSFYSNPSLAMLDLSNNNLMDISPSTFLAQINLFLIDLSANKLFRTPYGAFSRRVKTVLLQENPLVCSEQVHMLQQGVGIYIASSEDVICGRNKNLNQSSIGNNITSMSSTSAYFMVEHEEENNFKQGEKFLSPKTSPVIRPLSITNNEINKTKEGIGEQEKVSRKQVIPARPVNAPATLQSSLSSQSKEMLNIKQLTDDVEHQVTSIPELQNYSVTRYDDYDKVVEGTELRNKNRTEEQPHKNSFDSSNTIYPFPIPFLKGPSKLSKAYSAGSRTITATNSTYGSNRTSSGQTLPPSIVIANHIEETDYTTLAQETDKNDIGKISVENIKEIQESGEQIFFGLDHTERLEHVTAPSVIILICLSTVAIVMATVLIGLCIAKHRRLQTFHGSMTTDSAARTNAYVAAQLDMIYGTVRRNRNMSIPNRFEDGQPWIYAPTSYGTTYYK